jgi:enoyl-CoA hydratase/carnithine racemase
VTVGLVDVMSDGFLARLTLTRPDQRNAMSMVMLDELVGSLGRLAVEPEIRVVVLAGDGPDFCAGADFDEIEAAGAGSEAAAYGDRFEQALRAVTTHPTPVIAQVHGAALGAGCQLVVACDLAVVAEDARFGIPSARLGILINFENVQRLVLAVGPKRAGEMLFTGRTLSGVEAVAWGLANAAAPATELAERTSELAAAVAECAPLSVRGSKRGIGVVLDKLSVDRLGEPHRIADFDALAAQALASEDLAEGIRAFRGRRRPRFRGR